MCFVYKESIMDIKEMHWYNFPIKYGIGPSKLINSVEISYTARQN